jgi:hypothetical protein
VVADHQGGQHQGRSELSVEGRARSLVLDAYWRRALVFALIPLHWNVR